MLESLTSSLGLVGILITGLIAMVILYGAAELVKHMGRNKSADGENAGKITVKVEVTGKRTQGRNYYATFQDANGDREELDLPGEEYGMLAEGDDGLLTKMDGQFVSFERNRE